MIPKINTFVSNGQMAVGISQCGYDILYSKHAIVWRAASLPITAQWSNINLVGACFEASTHTSGITITSSDGIEWSLK